MLDPHLPSEADGALHRPPPPPTWRGRIEALADATATTPARILAGGALAAVAVLGGLWLIRPPAAPPEATIPYAAPAAPAAPASSSSTTTAVVVHVAGAVGAPGLVELAAGARVADAIAAAGGLTPHADSARINLAAPLVDGERVYVLAVGEEQPAVAVGSLLPDRDETAAASPVDLNTADADALDALPGVGPATAAAILQHRREVGAFTSVDQLLDVPGIGEAKLEALRDLVTV